MTSKVPGLVKFIRALSDGARFFIIKCPDQWVRVYINLFLLSSRMVSWKFWKSSTELFLDGVEKEIRRFFDYNKVPDHMIVIRRDRGLLLVLPPGNVLFYVGAEVHKQRITCYKSYFMKSHPKLLSHQHNQILSNIYTYDELLSKIYPYDQLYTALKRCLGYYKKPSFPSTATKPTTRHSADNNTQRPGQTENHDNNNLSNPF